MRRAWEVKDGIELALSRSPIPSEYFDAVTDDDHDAARLEYTTNKARFMTGVRR